MTAACTQGEPTLFDPFTCSLTFYQGVTAIDMSIQGNVPAFQVTSLLVEVWSLGADGTSQRVCTAVTAKDYTAPGTFALANKLGAMPADPLWSMEDCKDKLPCGKDLYVLVRW
jgi:hypothetical protein